MKRIMTARGLLPVFTNISRAQSDDEAYGLLLYGKPEVMVSNCDDVKMLRDAVDELTKRCQELENEIIMLKRKNQSLTAWHRTVFPPNKWATGHL